MAEASAFQAGQHTFHVDSSLNDPHFEDSRITTANEEPDTEHGKAQIGPTRTIEDLVHPPKDIAGIRKMLFEVKDKIELHLDEFERLWPYVDNVWVRQHTGRAAHSKSGQLTTDYYACRLQRPTHKSTVTDRPDGAPPQRKKRIREGGICHMRVKLVRFEGGYRSISIQQVGEQSQHSHDLDTSDKIKRTSVLMSIARHEVSKGYMPASVSTIMAERQENLIASGGKYLSRNDVRNASQAWRQAYTGELRVHEGYKYDQGRAVVRQVDVPENQFTGTASSDRPQAPLDPALNIPDALRYPINLRPILEHYLPPESSAAFDSATDLPHVTLTYATSLDSCISLAPGVQTHLSGPVSKAMTHFLRSRHDAILVGVGTAIADNPSLNCRLEGVGGYGGFSWKGQPRPVVIDPSARWQITHDSSIMKMVKDGKGKAPWVIVAPGTTVSPQRVELLKFYGGRYIGLSEFDNPWRIKWEAILKALARAGIHSVMVEGGGRVINDLLLPQHQHIINSTIITIAPTLLGRGGVWISPTARHDFTGRPQPALRLEDVRWQPLGEDAIMCGRPKKKEGEGTSQAPLGYSAFSGPPPTQDQRFWPEGFLQGVRESAADEA